MAMFWEFLFLQLFWERLSNKTKTNYLLISKTKTKVISWLLSTLDRKLLHKQTRIKYYHSRCVQLFRQRLSHKAYTTMPIGIMGRKSLSLIRRIKVHGFYQQEKRRHKYICLLFRFMSLKHLKPESRTMNPHYPKHLLALSSTVLRHSILNSSI